MSYFNNAVCRSSQNTKFLEDTMHPEMAYSLWNLKPCAECVYLHHTIFRYPFSGYRCRRRARQHDSGESCQNEVSDDQGLVAFLARSVQAILFDVFEHLLWGVIDASHKRFKSIA